MRTAQEILNNHYPLDFITERTRETVLKAMKEYAQEVAREALKNASERATTKQGYCSDGWTPSVRVVDKQSILNESNIPSI